MIISTSYNPTHIFCINQNGEKVLKMHKSLRATHGMEWVNELTNTYQPYKLADLILDSISIYPDWDKKNLLGIFIRENIPSDDKLQSFAKEVADNNSKSVNRQDAISILKHIIVKLTGVYPSSLNQSHADFIVLSVMANISFYYFGSSSEPFKKYTTHIAEIKFSGVLLEETSFGYGQVIDSKPLLKATGNEGRESKPLNKASASKGLSSPVEEEGFWAKIWRLLQNVSEGLRVGSMALTLLSLFVPGFAPAATIGSSVALALEKLEK